MAERVPYRFMDEALAALMDREALPHDGPFTAAVAWEGEDGEEYRCGFVPDAEGWSGTVFRGSSPERAERVMTLYLRMEDRGGFMLTGHSGGGTHPWSLANQALFALRRSAG